MTESPISPSPAPPRNKRLVCVATLALFVFAFILGIGLRAPRLAERPMHTDESNLAIKFGGLLESGAWKYDKTDHHGPALHYLTLPYIRALGISKIEDVSEATLRTVPLIVCMSLMLVSLTMCRSLGFGSVATAALFLAVSPIFVYYSRYYIMELLLVLFCLTTIIFGWRYWKSRNPWWLVPTGISLAMMHATKETCVIHYFAMGAAVVGCAVAGWIRPGSGEAFTAKTNERPLKRNHTIVLLVAVFVTWLLFFSSFFTNFPAGLIESITTYASYVNRAEGVGHQKPWIYYLQLLIWKKDHYLWSEAGLFVFALAGAGFAFFRKPKADGSFLLPRFLVFYAVTLAVVYSLISYKTPWTILGFHHVIILLAGFGAAGLWQSLRNRWARSVLAIIVVTMCVHLGHQARRATSSRLAADPRNPYVYMHTSTAFKRLLKRLDTLASVKQSSGSDGADDWLHVQVMHSESAWPLPWYTRMHKTIGFPAQFPSDEILSRTDVVVTEPGFADYFREHLAETHVEDGIYSLRPDQEGQYDPNKSNLLNVFVRQSLWDAFMEKQSQFRAPAQ